MTQFLQNWMVGNILYFTIPSLLISASTKVRRHFVNSLSPGTRNAHSQVRISLIGHSMRYYWTRPYWCCSVAQSCTNLCDPTDCSTPVLPVPHHLPKFAQVQVHCIGDAIQPSHPQMPSSPSVLNLSQHQGLFQRVSYLHQMTKILELQHLTSIQA